MTGPSTHASLAVPVGERDRAQGPVDAPVTLVEYGDYECPYTRRSVAVIRGLRRRLGDDLRFVFRNFPLTQIHPHAQARAEAAEAAGAQGRFWEMFDYLFDHQKMLGDDLSGAASEVGLDVARFAEDLQQHTHAARVREDYRGGVESGVRGTPTFFINGVRYDGSHDLQSLLGAIEGTRGP